MSRITLLAPIIIASDVSDYAADIGALVNASLSVGYDGMLIGPYHPRYAEAAANDG